LPKPMRWTLVMGEHKRLWGIIPISPDLREPGCPQGRYRSAEATPILGGDGAIDASERNL